MPQKLIFSVYATSVTPWIHRFLWRQKSGSELSRIYADNIKSVWYRSSLCHFSTCLSNTKLRKLMRSSLTLWTRTLHWNHKPNKYNGVLIDTHKKIFIFKWSTALMGIHGRPLFCQAINRWFWELVKIAAIHPDFIWRVLLLSLMKYAGRGSFNLTQLTCFVHYSLSQPRPDLSRHHFMIAYAIGGSLSP